MTFRVLGEGPTLVLLPGLASTYRGYAPTLLRLAGRFRTIQLDYPGEHADDGARLGRITHDDLVDDLFGLVDHLGLSSAFLFGLSFGSTITLKALHREPRRFPKAALQGGFARRRLRPPGNGWRSPWEGGSRGDCFLSRLPFHERGTARLNNRRDLPRPTNPTDGRYMSKKTAGRRLPRSRTGSTSSTGSTSDRSSRSSLRKCS